MANENDFLSQLLGGAIQAMATRPQKTSETSTTESISTPYALANMIANRNRIGQASRDLDNALKIRESTGYTLANALASIPQQQGYGSWLSNLANSFGSAMSSPMNAYVDRATQKRQNELEDLAAILNYDKAMGDRQTQKTTQVSGYTPMEYGTVGGKQGGSSQPQSQVPVLTPGYWEQMISNFDEFRPTEEDYRKQTQLGRKARNAIMIAGSPTENYARQQFDSAKSREFLPLARNVLKGTGPITDFEDKKYTEWLNKVKDPVELKDTAVRMVDDVAVKNGWTSEQKSQALNSLGLTSEASNLLEQQVKHEPERVKQSPSLQDILKKHGAVEVIE